MTHDNPIAQKHLRIRMAGIALIEAMLALGVVMAAGGYPADVRKGDEIHGLDKAAALPGKVFHAGTTLKDGKVVTSGGRVLCATALGQTVSEAQANAYALAQAVSWEGEYHRSDIGYRAVAREEKK